MANHLRVGLVLDDTLDSQDGVQQMVLLLGSWLHDRGHEVHYLVGDTKRTDVERVHSLASTKRLSFNGNTVRIPMPARKQAVKRLLHSLNLDILHVQMPYSPMLAGKVVAAATSEVVVGTFHILPYGRFAAHGTKLLSAVQRRNLSRFAATSATSAAAADFARSHYRLSPSVIPNPIELRRFQPVSMPKKSDKTQIVFLGRLVERKGVLQLLRAIDMLSDEVKQTIVLTIGGAGPQRRVLERFVLEHNFKDIVTFAGRISEDDKAGFLAQADIAVFPSLSGESFGIVLLEAMAAGAGVVLGGNNPGYQSVLGEWAECLVDPSDTKHFAKQLTRFIVDGKLRRQMHASQQSAVKQYDIAMVGPQFEAMYKQAILDSAHQLA